MRLFLISFFVLFTFVTSSNLFAQKAEKSTCKASCDAYEKCSLLRYPNASQEQLKQFKQGCLKGCKKNASAVDTCFKPLKGVSAPNVAQCTTYHTCIITAYQQSSKK